MPLKEQGAYNYMREYMLRVAPVRSGGGKGSRTPNGRVSAVRFQGGPARQCQSLPADHWSRSQRPEL